MPSSSGILSNRIDLAANMITIQPNVIVTITGDAGPAHVYTNNPNYSGFGGTNPANGHLWWQRRAPGAATRERAAA